MFWSTIARTSPAVSCARTYGPQTKLRSRHGHDNRDNNRVRYPRKAGCLERIAKVIATGVFVSVFFYSGRSPCKHRSQPETTSAVCPRPKTRRPPRVSAGLSTNRCGRCPPSGDSYVPCRPPATARFVRAAPKGPWRVRAGPFVITDAQ